nr:hypothetical protein BaRGS_010704 [Batillaria attramentaria]
MGHADEGIFFLGATGTGLEFHAHNDARNGVVFGMKRWFLYPVNRHPPGGMDINSMEWYEHIYLSQKLTEEDKPLECVQEAGEIIYIPEGYWHAVINIGDTIGMTLLARKPVTVLQKLRKRDWERDDEMKKKKQSGADLTEGDLKATYSSMRKLHRIFPDNTFVMVQLAYAYRKAGQREKAIGLLLKAVDVDPYCAFAHILLSKIMIEATTKKSAKLDVWRELMEAQQLSGDTEGAMATENTIRTMTENV